MASKRKFKRMSSGQIMSSFVGSASFSEMGSSQGFKRRSHKVAQATVFKKTLRGQEVSRGRSISTSCDNSGEKEVSSLDQVSASKTGDRLSSSVYNFPFGYLSSSFSCPALIPSSPRLCRAGSQLLCI